MLSDATKTVPTAVLVIGMAGAGKTTVMHRINLFLQERNKKGYYVNLDPAVRDVPFAANIDIRDTVNYKEVMKQYGLGPNGGILTSLNLFATRFDQVLGILERRANELDYIFIDTPGQIESFTWSAGGQIIHELLATAFPTVIMYVTDTPRCSSPTTFMSNMLYASSVLYKSQLPMVCVFNKIDVCPCAFAEEWMQSFEAYQEALDTDGNSNEEDYMCSLNRSLSLAMDEFYKNIKSTGISAATGDGIPKLFECIDEAAIEFKEIYLPDLLLRLNARSEADKERQEKDLERLQKDISASKGDKLIVDVKAAKVEAAAMKSSVDGDDSEDDDNVYNASNSNDDNNRISFTNQPIPFLPPSHEEQYNKSNNTDVTATFFPPTPSIVSVIDYQSESSTSESVITAATALLNI